MTMTHYSQNNQFSDLYNKNNPSSLFGLKFTLPLFQGMNRLENLSKAKLQYQTAPTWNGLSEKPD